MISNGAPPQKLILGITFYGKSFNWNTETKMIGASAVFGEVIGYKQVL